MTIRISPLSVALVTIGLFLVMGQGGPSLPT